MTIGYLPWGICMGVSPTSKAKIKKWHSKYLHEFSLIISKQVVSILLPVLLPIQHLKYQGPYRDRTAR